MIERLYCGCTVCTPLNDSIWLVQFYCPENLYCLINEIFRLVSKIICLGTSSKIYFNTQCCLWVYMQRPEIFTNRTNCTDNLLKLIKIDMHQMDEEKYWQMKRNFRDVMNQRLDAKTKWIGFNKLNESSWNMRMRIVSVDLPCVTCNVLLTALICIIVWLI